MEYIARRMRKLHPKAEIKEFGDYISFQPINGYAKITLYPIWKEGIKCIREDLSDDVDLALDKIKSNIHKKIYLVYPKSEHFKKHVEIKSSFINPIDCELKVIPYRLSCSFKKRLKDFEFQPS
eukprot:TRINITY_DN95319_c0_g1_i1.p4 TRINITY_DN95319_c0_g1~~TRINITY_DN95319_c0_g1_i1.p4  ORF type:complete len:123 (+),score=8.74 TRINITY_DN95319_c0_g1_i1:707-1075(+)